MAQVFWSRSPRYALTGTFWWARSRDLAAARAPKLDVFSSDVGAEVRGVEWGAGRSLSLRPFAGAGAGVRSYNYRNLDAAATHNVAGYGALGAVVGVKRASIRVEVREYASHFAPLVGAGTTSARNDAVVSISVRLNRRYAAVR